MHFIVLHSTVLHSTVLHFTVLHFTVLHSTVLHLTALHYISLNCTTVHCTLLNLTVSHCTVYCNVMYSYSEVELSESQYPTCFRSSSTANLYWQTFANRGLGAAQLEESEKLHLDTSNSISFNLFPSFLFPTFLNECNSYEVARDLQSKL